MFKSPMHFYIHYYGTEEDLELVTNASLNTKEAIDALDVGDFKRAQDLWGRVNRRALFEAWKNQNECAKKLGPKWAERIEAPRGPKTSPVSPSLAKRIYERDCYKCRYCGLPVFTRRKGSAILRLVSTFEKESHPLRVINGSLYGTGKNGAVTNSDYGKFLWSLAACDHVFPRSLGGATDETNLVTSCSGCNYSKVDLTLSQMNVKSPLVVDA